MGAFLNASGRVESLDPHPLLTNSIPHFNFQSCIVSTFKLKRGVSQQKILERLEKVALHEIGHNLGLNHCTNNKECMMSAANGTIQQVDNEKVWFCEKCRKQLN